MAKENKSLIDKILGNNSIDEYIKAFPNSIGSHGFDPWGLNVKNFRNNVRFAKYLYDKIYKVEAFGLDNIPKEGRCLVISNHSGQLPFDGMLVGYAMLSNPDAPRAPKAMIERFLPSVPFIGNWLSSVGAVIGDPVNCTKMLNNEEAIIVFPEGVRGSNKLYKHRYQLQRFGNGFMHLAMKTNTPIIPVSVVGMEETIRSYADIKPLAKILGMPVAPLVIPYIFPSEVYIHFGKPLYFDNDVYKESDVLPRVEQVKDAIKNLMAEGKEMRDAYYAERKQKKSNIKK